MQRKWITSINLKFCMKQDPTRKNHLETMLKSVACTPSGEPHGTNKVSSNTIKHISFLADMLEGLSAITENMS